MEIRDRREEEKNSGQPSGVWGSLPGSGHVNRESARGVLLDASRRAYRHLRALQLLEVVVDWEKLSIEEEEILWHFFLTIDR